MRGLICFKPVAFVVPQILVAGQHFANSQACALIATNLAKRCITDTDHRRKEQIILKLVWDLCVSYRTIGAVCP